MGYAIVAIHGKQHMVKPGDTIRVDAHVGEVGKELADVSVLLYKDDKVEVGTPTVSKKASLMVVEHTKGEKIRVATYRSKSRYRKVRGHRQEQTVLRVEAIGSMKAPKAAAKTTATKSSAESKKAADIGAKPDAKKAEKQTAPKKAEAKKAAVKKVAAKPSADKKPKVKPAAKK